MRTLISSERLRILFEAHRDRDDAVFVQTAGAIISDELASNHHHSATVLQRALVKSERGDQANGTMKASEMRSIPKDRRHGEDLLFLQESPVTADRVFLTAATRRRIDRILEEHRSRNKLLASGYRPKTKLLFWGPPGTGKTLTAFLLASELGLPIGVLRLSSVISSFLGDTASHLQKVFARAASTPMVLLLDEVDAIGKNRDDPNDVGELKRIVNSLLQVLDLFSSSDSVIIAASNHQYLLDPALWRRFDDVVDFPMPGKAERQQLLRYLLNGVAFRGSIAQAAATMASMSFADVEHVAVEAVKTMILAERPFLTASDLSRELTHWRDAVRSAQRRRGKPAK